MCREILLELAGYAIMTAIAAVIILIAPGLRSLQISLILIAGPIAIVSYSMTRRRKKEGIEPAPSIFRTSVVHLDPLLAILVGGQFLETAFIPVGEPSGQIWRANRIPMRGDYNLMDY